jgi:hypothetical protein
MTLPPGCRNQPWCDRITADRDHDRNRRSRGFCRQRRRRAANRCNCGHRTAHQIRCQCRQTFVLCICEAILDCDSPALYKALLAKAAMKRGYDARAIARRQAAEKPNHRHRRLLRACRERPRRRRANE